LGIIVDPASTTGSNYEVRFRSTAGGTVYDIWRIPAVGAPVRVDSNRTNQSDVAGAFNYPIVDGVMFKVFGAAQGVKDFWIISNAAGPINPPTYAAFGFNGSGFPTTLAGNPDRPDANQQVGGGHWGFHTGEVGGGFLYDFFLARTFRGTNFSRFIPSDWEMRFTAAGGFGNWAFTTGNTAPVPFELWNIGIATPDNPADDYRVIPWVLDDDNGEPQYQDVYNLTPFDHTISGGDNDPYMDWVYFRNPTNTAPGTAGYDQFVADGANYDFNSPEVMARTVLVNWNGGSVSDPTFPANVNQAIPETGTTFRIISTKPNTTLDVFKVTSVAPVKNNLALAKQQAALVNVFPNPYTGFNIEERDPVNRFVTFTHLSPSAKIRIFTLAGELIRTINHTDGTQFERWDLRNANDIPVASGMYICHIELPNIGERILKLAVLGPQERIDVF
jgi:hypothetical protein